MEPHPNDHRRRFPKAAVALIIVAMFLGLLIVKLATADRPVGAPPPAGGDATPASITSVRNDALADYERALRTGKPIYVRPVPFAHVQDVHRDLGRGRPRDAGLQGRVVFVNAITDDASAQRLASRFHFQYIPTSFFVSSAGEVQASYTGSMDAVRLLEYLDALTEAE